MTLRPVRPLPENPALGIEWEGKTTWIAKEFQ